MRHVFLNHLLFNNKKVNQHIKKGEDMVEFSEFKGNKVIILKRDENDKYPFSFGITKAKLILEHIEDIKKFVEENKTTQKV